MIYLPSFPMKRKELMNINGLRLRISKQKLLYLRCLPNRRRTNFLHFKQQTAVEIREKVPEMLQKARDGDLSLQEVLLQVLLPGSMLRLLAPAGHAPRYGLAPADLRILPYFCLRKVL